MPSLTICWNLSCWGFGRKEQSDGLAIVTHSVNRVSIWLWLTMFVKLVKPPPLIPPPKAGGKLWIILCRRQGVSFGYSDSSLRSEWQQDYSYRYFDRAHITVSVISTEQKRAEKSQSPMRLHGWISRLRLKWQNSVMLRLAEASDCGLQRRLRRRIRQSDSSLSLRMTVKRCLKWQLKKV